MLAFQQYNRLVVRRDVLNMPICTSVNIIALKSAAQETTSKQTEATAVSDQAASAPASTTVPVTSASQLPPAAVTSVLKSTFISSA